MNIFNYPLSDLWGTYRGEKELTVFSGLRLCKDAFRTQKNNEK